jgi:hypothetical protein
MTGDSSFKGKMQSVWIVRYGLTKFPLVEGVGPYDSECKGINQIEVVSQQKIISQHLINVCAFR